MKDSGNKVSWLHRLASLVSVMAFLLLMTGLLASEAGGNGLPLNMAVGNPSADPPNKYEPAYIVLAIALIILTVALTFLLMKSASSRYLKVLGSVTTAVLLVVAVLVLSREGELFSKVAPFVYSFGMQVFFSLTVCLALFTRTDWRWDEPKSPDLAAPSIRQIVVFATAIIFLETLLGQAFNEKVLGIAPHIVLGIVATLCSLWVLEMALTKYSHLRTFKMSAIFFAELVGLQLFLGIISYSMELNARAVPGSQPGLAVMNVTHASIGALVLATSLFVTFQAFKYLAPAESVAFSTVADQSRTSPSHQD